MTATGYYTDAACDAAAFEREIDAARAGADAPLAARIVHDVPVYEVDALSAHLRDAGQRRLLMAEWAHVLADGAGVIVLRGAYGDTGVIDEATAVFDAIIKEEAAAGAGRGDHFAGAGANSRVWNAAQKLCLTAPEVYARYVANPVIDAASEAWLGPGYQMTAQLNVVRPGGKAQTAHRDYHLGFQDAVGAAAFPAHVHGVSPMLTLQGAIAHCDMPVESGPTKLLPFSQRYGPGYLAYRMPAFRELFEARSVQLELTKGDALFFNPALFHAAGDNVTPDIHRMANLLQVSSPFGRAMEALDRSAMSRALYPQLFALRAEQRLGKDETDAAIAATAEGYPFPTNLDSDPPIGGLAPETQAALMRRALDEGMGETEFNAAIRAQDARRRA